MQSMTGYSKRRFEDERHTLSMEIKSVNNKNLNLKIKMDSSLNFMENLIRTEVSKYITRGSVDLKIDFSEKEQDIKSYDFDKTLLEGTLGLLKELEENYQDKIENKLQFVIEKFPIIKKNSVEIDEEGYQKTIINQLRELLKNHEITKSQEGERLKLFFVERLNLIEERVNRIEILKERQIDTHRERLLERVNSIKKDVNFNEEDILKEVLLYADRVDISEELVRLKSHISQLKMDFNNNKERLGKKIDFILQEMFRELNTTGVKSNLYDISKLVVEAKNELEKMREQALNVE